MNYEGIIQELKENGIAAKEDLVALLQCEDGAVSEALFSAAREVREKYFGNKVFLYGFLYFSTYCRNNCSFCYYRRDNDNTSVIAKTKKKFWKSQKVLPIPACILSTLL